MLGLPVGTLLGFMTVGAIATAAGSWRAPFFVAAVPGLVLAAAFLWLREPVRGAAEAQAARLALIANPIGTLLRIRTLWWLILSGIGYNFAAYAGTTFMVPLLQRHFHLALGSAAAIAGVLIGVTGVLGMTLGGVVADAAHRRNDRGRLLLCCAAMGSAAVLIWLALRAECVSTFAWLFGVGWLIAYLYHVCIYPVIQELVVPQLRATAMAVFFAAMYVLGAAFGSLVVGAYSDHLAQAFAAHDGSASVAEVHRAAGLHGALMLVPLSLLVAGFACWMAGRTLRRDLAVRDAVILVQS